MAQRYRGRRQLREFKKVIRTIGEFNHSNRLNPEGSDSRGTGLPSRAADSG